MTDKKKVLVGQYRFHPEAEAEPTEHGKTPV